MFKTLSYDVKFAPNVNYPEGREIKRDFSFTTGLTAIFGANESGKSTSLEMIRFALFGSGALRGKADDYKRCRVTLVFEARDETYRIERTLKNATMSRGNEAIATGTTAVNNKVVDLLGFGLGVFDIGCAANQGDLEALAKMRPADRKRMIDNVVGIGALESVTKWAGEEASLRTKEATGMRSVLTTPVKPEAPQDYEESGLLENKVATLDRLNTELQGIRGWLQQTLTKPLEPLDCVTDLSVEALRQKVDQQSTARRAVARLEATLAGLPTAYVAEERLQAIRAQNAAVGAYEDAQAWLRRHPKPAQCPTSLKLMRDQWARRSVWLEQRRVLQNISLLEGKGSRPCPHCNEDIPHEHDAILRERAKLEGVELIALEPPEPMLPLAKVELLLEQWTQFLPVAARHAQESAVEAPPKPEHDLAWVKRAEADNAAFERRAVVEKDLAEARALIDNSEDWEALLRARQLHDQMVIQYRRLKAAYDEWLLEREAKQQRADELRDVPTALDTLRQRLADARTYERLHDTWLDAQAKYDEAMERVTELEAEAEQFKRVKNALTLLRTRVKQHLIPSLAAVSSKLISEMTGGQRNIITIDDDFNVTVDGQSMDTLSGSAKAVANLSMRLALGQVLTSLTLPVFLADEIDQSMDANRANCTSETLRNLQKRLSQIIIVSHKEIDADHAFDLTAAA